MRWSATPGSITGEIHDSRRSARRCRPSRRAATCRGPRRASRRSPSATATFASTSPARIVPCPPTPTSMTVVTLIDAPPKSHDGPDLARSRRTCRPARTGGTHAERRVDHRAAALVSRDGRTSEPHALPARGAGFLVDRERVLPLLDDERARRLGDDHRRSVAATAFASAPRVGLSRLRIDRAHVGDAERAARPPRCRSRERRPPISVRR